MSLALSKNFLVKSFEDYDQVFNFIKERDSKLVLFSGDLGAGKTTFIGLFLASLSKSNEAIKDFMSPTFSVINQYELNESLISHVDLYRLEEDEIYDLGLEEIVDESLITFIEWYKKAEEYTKSLSKEPIILEFKKLDEDVREVNVFC